MTADRRPRRAGIAALTMLALSLVAADGKPAAKDSPTRAKPKEVTMTTSVSPATAKPGDTVTYTVKAKVGSGWHIYKFADKDPDAGPRPTKFDLFDTGGLKAEGYWKPSKEATTRKEPAFPEIDSVSFYEDEVSWSRKLVVPADAAAGKVAIKCQASYQICSDKSCSFPGRWTLPEALLTIEGTAAAPAPRADRAGNPTQATFAVEVVPSRVAPGGTATLKVSAKVDDGWHLFATDHDGGERTTFALDLPPGLVADGEWTAVGPPIDKAPELGTGGKAQRYFEHSAVWTLPLKVAADAPAGDVPLAVQASYQVCSDKTCTSGRLTLPAALLSVVTTGTTAVASVPTTKLAGPEPTPAPSAAPPVAPKGIGDQGLIPFLLASAGAGLLALVMPCVWPMVPITVNFFVKQGKAGGGKATGLAVTYCLSIIVIFTLVGVLFSAFLGASAAQNLATNPWLNMVVAGMFLAFGVSLLGLFEFRLPSALVNASSEGEGRGGLVGVIFMALTLTITSFTCTFPVVGSLLVLAANGTYIYPIIGLATFAAVLALPFFLLALAPGLLQKMPKSGDWMNTVKVVGGLLEVAAAFKFVNNVEIGFGTIPEDAVFNAGVVLAIWIVASLVSGMYLLGLFQSDHDMERPKVGAGRLLIGSMFLALSLHVTPALFGRPPHSRIWDQGFVALLPPDVGTLRAPTGGGGVAEAEQRATSSKLDEALRQETRFHGVRWGMSFEAAQAQAKADNRPILIDFTGVFCTNCRLMEETVMTRPEVISLLKQFVPVELYTDRMPIDSLSAADREAAVEANRERELDLAKLVSNPFYIVLSPSGEVLESQEGASSASTFAEFLKRGLAKHAGGGKVAAAGSR